MLHFQKEFRFSFFFTFVWLWLSGLQCGREKVKNIFFYFLPYKTYKAQAL